MKLAISKNGGPAPTEPLDPTAFARATIAASKRHMAQSALLTVCVATLSAVVGTTGLHLAAIGTIGAFLILYNLLRIRAAKRALRLGPAGTDFIQAQRRSHLIRGKLYMVVSPLVVLAVGIGLAGQHPPAPSAEWIAFAACSAFLGYGWVWWVRALRRVRLWRAPEASSQA